MLSILPQKQYQTMYDELMHVKHWRSRLAKRLGIDYSNISGWAKRGVPKHHWPAIVDFILENYRPVLEDGDKFVGVIEIDGKSTEIVMTFKRWSE